MKNVDKKWALFIISTFVCMYGIGYTLINVTFAIDVLPVDDRFNDNNFYRCVIDTYNSLYSLNLDYTERMDDYKLRNIKSLSCNDKDMIDRNKINSFKGIELMTSLEEVNLTYTNATKIDLSNNINLNKVNLEGNKFIDNLYVYNGETMFLNTGVVLPGQLISNKVSWSNNNREMIGISFYGKVTTKNTGVTSVYGKSSLGYEVVNNIYVVDISSSKYHVDDIKSKIYIDNIHNFNIQDIECNDDNVYLELYYNDMELYVKYNDNVLKKFELIERDV